MCTQFTTSSGQHCVLQSCLSISGCSHADVWLPSISCYRWLVTLSVDLSDCLSLCVHVCLSFCLTLYVFLCFVCSLQHHPCCSRLTAALVLQIMLRLQAQDRPEIPDLDNLPGQPLPGITQYIKLMKVWVSLCDAVSPPLGLPPRHPCQQAPPLCLPVPALPFLQLVVSTCVSLLLSVVTSSDHMVASGSTYAVWKSAQLMYALGLTSSAHNGSPYWPDQL